MCCLACSYNRDFLNNRIKRTNIMYGGLRPDLRNVIFTNGDVDPWHALSVLQDLNAFSPAVLIKGNIKHLYDFFFYLKLINKFFVNCRIVSLPRFIQRFEYRCGGSDSCQSENTRDNWKLDLFLNFLSFRIPHI